RAQRLAAPGVAAPLARLDWRDRGRQEADGLCGAGSADAPKWDERPRARNDLADGRSADAGALVYVRLGRGERQECAAGALRALGRSGQSQEGSLGGRFAQNPDLGLGGISRPCQLPSGKSPPASRLKQLTFMRESSRVRPLS